MIRLAFVYLSGGRIDRGNAVVALKWLQSLGRGVNLPTDESSTSDPPEKMNPIHFLAEAVGLTKKRVSQIIQSTD